MKIHYTEEQLNKVRENIVRIQKETADYREYKTKKARKAYDRRKLLGWDLAEEDEYTLLAMQKGKCAICNKAPTKIPLRLDHDHKTGRVRGFLCNTCNFGIGALGDTPELLYAAIEYYKLTPWERFIERKVA